MLGRIALACMALSLGLTGLARAEGLPPIVESTPLEEGRDTLPAAPPGTPRGQSAAPRPPVTPRK